MRKICTAGNLPKGSLWTCLIDHCLRKNTSYFSFLFSGFRCPERSVLGDAPSALSGPALGPVTTLWSWAPAVLQHANRGHLVSQNQYLNLSCPVVPRSVMRYQILLRVLFLPAASCGLQHCPSCRWMGLLGFPGLVLPSLVMFTSILNPEGEFLGFTWLWAVIFLWHGFLAFDSSASLKATRV